MRRNKFAAVGEATHHVYFEAESKAEVFQWLIKKYPNRKAVKGNYGYSKGDILPEAMRVVRLQGGISKRRE